MCLQDAEFLKRPSAEKFLEANSLRESFFNPQSKTCAPKGMKTKSVYAKTSYSKIVYEKAADQKKQKPQGAGRKHETRKFRRTTRCILGTGARTSKVHRARAQYLRSKHVSRDHQICRASFGTTPRHINPEVSVIGSEAFRS